mmetsp:Transcript_6167/g.9355  ORF Transcript_6167/g.9355 Transcript_6167/m.9355 type:complete len:576 (+) Transcript_6167:62-1789(+)
MSYSNQFISTTIPSAKGKRQKIRLRRQKKFVALFSIGCVYLYCFTGEPPEVEVGRHRQLENTNKSQKKAKQGCTHTPYLLIGDILTTMPPIVPYEERYPVPSHIQLCQAFLERSAAVDVQVDNGNPNAGGPNDNPNAGGPNGDQNGNPNAGGPDDNPNAGGQNDNPNAGGRNGDPNMTRKLQSENKGQGGGGNGKGKGPPFKVVEDDAVCTDWQAPHVSTLQMYASSLIAAVGKPLGLRYQHKCRKNIMKMHQDPDRHYDYTPVQALLPNNLISKADVAKIEVETIKQLCENCVQWFENVMDTSIPPSAQTHQCLLMPSADIAQNLISQGKEMPMTHVMPSIIDRMRHIADDWITTTGSISKNEADVGVCICVDEGSSFMNFDVYDKLIPPAARSIQIFASANCAIASVEGRSNCIEHGRRLKKYFLQTRSRQHGTYVRYDVVGSSAASFSRMINSKILICPPGTVMCLLPALSKKAGTKAYVAEDPAHKETYHWFENHVLKERKEIGIQDAGYDAIPDEDFLQISEIASDTEMPVATIGEDPNEEHVPSDEDLSGEYENYTDWLSNARVDYVEN